MKVTQEHLNAVNQLLKIVEGNPINFEELLNEMPSENEGMRNFFLHQLHKLAVAEKHTDEEIEDGFNLYKSWFMEFVRKQIYTKVGFEQFCLERIASGESNIIDPATGWTREKALALLESESRKVIEVMENICLQ